MEGSDRQEYPGFDYDSLDDQYSRSRQTDPRIAEMIEQALGSARSVLNVGAGTGSYEPEDRYVVAVEPSSVMRSQRPAKKVPALACGAEQLPFDDGAFEASMALLSLHHWPDPVSGLRELRRVSSGPVLVMTFDPGARTDFWLTDYVPELREIERRRYGPLDRIVNTLGGRFDVLTVPVLRDCRDHLKVALYARPEMFLDKRVRQAQSSWSYLPKGVEERSVGRLARDLESGTWDDLYGHLREQSQITCQLRLVVALPDGKATC